MRWGWKICLRCVVEYREHCTENIRSLVLLKERNPRAPRPPRILVSVSFSLCFLLFCPECNHKIDGGHEERQETKDHSDPDCNTVRHFLFLTVFEISAAALRPCRAHGSSRLVLSALSKRTSKSVMEDAPEFFDDSVPIDDIPHDSRFWIRHPTVEQDVEERRQEDALGDVEVTNADDDSEVPYMSRPGSFTSSYTRYIKRTTILFDRDPAMRERRSKSTLMQFLLGHGHYLRSKDMAPDNAPTHVSLAGGKFKIPDTDLDMFHDLYAWELYKGHRMYMCVRPTPVQRLMFDFDFHHTKPVYARQLEMVAKICTGVVSKFYPERDSTDCFCVVSAASYKTKNDPIRLLVDGAAPVTLGEIDPEAQQIVKSGMHIVFPKIRVSVSQAFTIRENVIAELRERLGTRKPPANCWETVVDDKIYVESGLRMEGSLKIIVCPKCKRNEKKRPTCGFCGGVGGLEEGRPYRPMICLKGDGTRYLEQEELYKSPTNVYEGIKRVVKDTSIRVRAGIPADPDFDDSWDGCLQPIDRSKVQQRKKKKGPRKQPWQRALTPEEETMRSRQRMQRFEGYPLDSVQDFLRGLNENWSMIQVTEILANDKGTKYVVVVRGSGARWCGNIGTDHSSNHIYFTIERDGCCQRCHKGEDNKTNSVGGSGCSCKNYKSRKFNLPPAMADAFFRSVSAAQGDRGPTPRFFDLATAEADQRSSRRGKKVSGISGAAAARPRFSTSMIRHMHTQAEVERMVEMINNLHAKLSWKKMSVVIGSVDATGLGSRAAQCAEEMGMSDAIPKGAKRDSFQHVVRGDTVDEQDERVVEAASKALGALAADAVCGRSSVDRKQIASDLHRHASLGWGVGDTAHSGLVFASTVESSAF